MPFWPAVRQKHLRLASAIYFALLGAGTILADVFYGTTSIVWMLIAAVLILPLVFRQKYVYMLIGYLIAIVFGYFLFVLIAWLLHYLNGEHILNPTLTFGLGFPFTIGSFLLAVAMVYTGSKLSSIPKNLRPQI